MKQENLLTTLLMEGDSLMDISESASLRQNVTPINKQT